MPFASAQAALQCFVPSAGTQLQEGCAHLVVDFMCSPLVESAFLQEACNAEKLLNRIERPRDSIAPRVATICSVLLSLRTSPGKIPFARSA